MWNVYVFLLLTQLLGSAAVPPPETDGWEPGAIVTLPPTFSLLRGTLQEKAGMALSVAWGVQFGAPDGGMRPGRFSLEAGLARMLTKRKLSEGNGPFPLVRIGSQWVSHRLGSNWGYAVGYGVSYSATGGVLPRTSVSPELVLRYGNPAEWGFWALGVRAYYGGGRDLCGALMLGPSFW